MSTENGLIFLASIKLDFSWMVSGEGICPGKSIGQNDVTSHICDFSIWRANVFLRHAPVKVNLRPKPRKGGDLAEQKPIVTALNTVPVLGVYKCVLQRDWVHHRRKPKWRRETWVTTSYSLIYLSLVLACHPSPNFFSKMLLVEQFNTLISLLFLCTSFYFDNAYKPDKLT